jgi:hypothetical protein
MWKIQERVSVGSSVAFGARKALTLPGEALSVKLPKVWSESDNAGEVIYEP